MGRDLRIFFLAIGIPALAIACAGICLIRYEMKRERARQEQIERNLQRQHEGWRRLWTEYQQKRTAEARHPQRRPGAPQQGTAKPAPAGRRRGAGRSHMRLFSPALFSAEESVATERIVWIAGCMLGLLFLSFGAGGWLLVKSARTAREEALKKTDFLSNISHEFKTPLTTICLCAELAQDEGLAPERRRKALGSIMGEASRLKELVLAALDFSRLEKNRRAFCPTDCDLSVLAAEAAAPLRERFAAQGLVLPTEPCPVRADVGAVKQIVVILLDNAAKYASSGGPVEVACTIEAGVARLTVADRGPGLDREGLRHAFDRFWRGDNATTAETGGSGLGLAIGRSLARGMGGDLTVAGREGGGLVFTLELKS